MLMMLGFLCWEWPLVSFEGHDAGVVGLGAVSSVFGRTADAHDAGFLVL